MSVNENTTQANALNVATTDENLSIEGIFQQTSIPSLARSIFSNIPMNGPTAALFNVKNNTANDGIELVRAEVEVYASNNIPTGVTTEVITDITNMYGEKLGKTVIAKLLRGLANDEENTKTLTFLEASSTAETDLTLSSPASAETNVFEISQKVSELILKMNSKTFRTYNAVVVLPYKSAAAFFALHSYIQADDDPLGLMVTKIGNITYFVNPDPESTTAYVLLKDPINPSKSSGVFSEYQTTISTAINADTGNSVYFITNRFAITASPLDETDNKLFYKFDIVG